MKYIRNKKLFVGVTILVCMTTIGITMLIHRDRALSFEGKINRINCTNMGLGCTEYVLITDGGESQSLSSTVPLKPYSGKKVRITGSIESSSGPSYLQVKSIQEIQPESYHQAKPSKVVKVGVLGCLKPKDNIGPQTLSCAIGLQQDDGTYYGLSAKDPTLTGGIPTGQHIQVTGILTNTTASQYQSAGTIQVEFVERLD